MLLTVEALQTFYGKSHVLRDVSFTVPAGEAYVPVEGPRGEQGFSVVSDG